MASSILPVALQNKLLGYGRAQNPYLAAALNLDLIRNIVFFLFVFRYVRKTFYSLRGYGLVGSLRNVYFAIRLFLYSVFLRAPGVRGQVDKQVSEAIEGLENKLVTTGPDVTRYLALPKEGWTPEQIRAELEKLSNMEHTRWEDGRVSGAVYHEGKDLLKVQTEAFDKFGVANPLHPDVFPGVRKMEAEVVAMVLALFNAPSDGAGVTTSGGTESILMACLGARNKAYAERGVKEPEIIIPDTAHAAFYKACSYFGMKLHRVPCPAPEYKADVAAMRRLINPNTVLLVGSAPNFPHGMVDDIPALSRLATAYKIPLHVDCCLGSFVIAHLKKAGFPSPYEEEGGFDFRQPGVTSISVDTHKYGFAPKGNSVVLYRNRSYRRYQYFIYPDWSGGVYASPSVAGSRSGALIAGCWASMVSLGEHGYINSCLEIVGAAKKFEAALKENSVLKANLGVIGKPMVSLVAFDSQNGGIDIYDVADALSSKGWHLSALQSPPAIHVAFTALTARAVDKLISDLAEVVEIQLARAEERQRQGKSYVIKRGDTATLYGVAGSMPDKSIISRLAEGFLDTLYKA
ncbi:putative sphinganine-1-phosphate aldolase BST1 [Aspergillus campestris IBT 28561]|uniref:sphinganine-1-phosphate aldolase n=1 Tax=Aspergillus campestris (strain IBT 28561) TaxID=1392248 RepID=A0A2I1CYF1_ASPC2|nr:putative sphinganine-1-phosphate aldolase BST1 [Aspergillus campestris IBT 28561]PKY02655.1 putative sphinganine-1-phosphate aldolase BST1 [Aspergillus campestris IBT 28561]